MTEAARDLSNDLNPSTSASRRLDLALVKTVILAGGMGTRLRPYTSILPKPLLPLGDCSILELLMRQLARQGFTDITLSVGHLAHLIEAVLGNGATRNLDIAYVREDVPLGTAGSLQIVPGLEETFLAMNGDLVTNLDCRDLVRQHRAEGNMLTIATNRREMPTDYGVLTVDGGSGAVDRVLGYEEKPVFSFLVSMGIYVIEPKALAFMPEDGYFDIPDLVHRLLEHDARVGSYEYDGLWLDIGRHADYEQAIGMWEAGELAELFAEDPKVGPLRSAGAVTKSDEIEPLRS